MFADLHIHSTYSDGSLAPGEIITRAEQKKFSVISITDHDTTSHIAEATREAGKSKVTLIPGIEFSTLALGQEVHVLGYTLDQGNSSLARHLERVQGRRAERARRILERLESRNVRIPLDELDLIPQNMTVGRVFIARLLVNHGYVRTISEAFDRYIGNYGSAFVPYELTDAREVVALIRECRGISVLAHPSLQELESQGPLLREAGLEGVEAYRPGLTGAESQMIADKGVKMGLFLTGGSDWHFDGGRLNLGDFYVETRLIKDFLDRVDSSSNIGLES